MKFIITKLLVLSYRYKEHALSVDHCRIKPVTSGSRTVVFFTANSGFRFFVLTKMTVASCPARLAGAGGRRLARASVAAERADEAGLPAARPLGGRVASVSEAGRGVAGVPPREQVRRHPRG